jgi:hypothetical protein
MKFLSRAVLSTRALQSYRHAQCHCWLEVVGAYPSFLFQCYSKALFDNLFSGQSSDLHTALTHFEPCTLREMVPCYPSVVSTRYITYD